LHWDTFGFWFSNIFAMISCVLTFSYPIMIYKVITQGDLTVESHQDDWSSLYITYKNDQCARV